ncbi:MAG TPA: c-type cytochrome [Macromonas sp.]|nr:c-type cytochrome [Macromonas sp.]
MSTRMTSANALLATAFALALLGTAHAESPAPQTTSLVQRGAYLVNFAGCADCHTPHKLGPRGPEPDLSRRMSGHPESLPMPAAPKLEGLWNWAGAAPLTAFAGPWGVSYASNITPDKDTGIGLWRLEDFVGAMRTGQHMGAGRPILPPMPWQGVGKLSDEDLRALYSYLMSLPPVKNSVPVAVMAHPAP